MHNERNVVRRDQVNYGATKDGSLPHDQSVKSSRLSKLGCWCGGQVLLFDCARDGVLGPDDEVDLGRGSAFVGSEH